MHPQRPRHPDRELEQIIRSAELQGWRVTKRPRGYFKLLCPCPDKHLKTLHVTPSDPNYVRNLRSQLRRATCWEEEPR